MWSHMPSDLTRILIENKMRGQYGLAPKKWVQQLEEIRGLPEAKR